VAQLQQTDVRNRLLKAMSPEDFARLQPSLEFTDLPLLQVLIVPNERVEHFYFLESGISSITAQGDNGRVEVGIVGRERLVGAVPLLLGSDRVPQLRGDLSPRHSKGLSPASYGSPSRQLRPGQVLQHALGARPLQQRPCTALSIMMSFGPG
jgi:CRP-like cAMP-binding protein